MNFFRPERATGVSQADPAARDELASGPNQQRSDVSPSPRADEDGPPTLGSTEPRWRSAPKLGGPLGLGVVLVVFGGITGVLLAFWWTRVSSYETTDDAFLEGHIIRVAPRVAGHVRKCYVDDNQEVQKGQLLVEIDPDMYRVGLKAAEAQGEEAYWEWRRMEAMRKSLSVSEFDLQKAKAKALSLEALAESARLQLAYTQIVAPVDGRVTKKTVEEGNYVRVGDTLFSLVPKNVWVVANFKESQLTWMRPGQPAEIRVDAYPQRRWKGHVDSIQRGSGARFSLLPPENATGNYVKVVQRVPVKIVFDEPIHGPYELGPGMSVVPTVKVKDPVLSAGDVLVAATVGSFSGALVAGFAWHHRKKRELLRA
ncbi:HlyD family secretion protein [Candidatus Methylacidithermus pantelleriae]|uniref:Multidrug resistance efflux pump n=1 Tax=Candidatus Methylacidithermus pantelleriae TaxID=2744239 RepID=A0A8J2BQS4_9BACT|nr:HlyD family secretion protein [Candidatus Methylacidithermus pantelleriae]CAF0704484.1 Multidrug resistance efflux pump [Candidatus Methylacidithermus pantelleriae]